MGALGTRSSQYRDTTAETRPASAGRSLLRTSPFLVVLAIAVADAFNYADLDLWVHIATGRIILAAHHIPVVDTFSYTFAGHHVHNHEWLAEVMLALGWRALGSFGLRLLKMVSVSVMVLALARAIDRTQASARMSRAVLLLCAAGVAPFMHLRPDLFTMMLLAIEMAMLSADVYQGHARLWPMIFLFALWANLHGGFMAGLGALGLYAVVTLAMDTATGAGIRRGMRLVGLTVACVLATLVNPFGIHLWRTVIVAANSSVLRQHMFDWVPLWPQIALDLRTAPVNALIFAVPLVLVAATIFVVLKTPTRDDLPLVVIATVFIVAAFETTRNLPLAIIVLAAPLARHAALARHLKRERNRVSEKADKSPNGILLAGLALALVLIGGEVSAAPLRVVPPSPVGAVAFMNKHDLGGNILNDYLWGDYLIWHTYPRSHVFIDGRMQLLYSEKFIRRYIAFYEGQTRGMALLNEYPNDLVLMSPKSGAFRLVSADPRWKLIYRDGVAALFVKSSSKAAREFPHPVVEKSSPSLFP